MTRHAKTRRLSLDLVQRRSLKRTPYLRIVKTGLTTESISEIIHLSINPFIYAERLFKLVIFSTLLKPLISVAVEKSETKPFLCVFDRLSSLAYKRETPHVIHGWKAYDVSYTCDWESLTLDQWNSSYYT